MRFHQKFIWKFLQGLLLKFLIELLQKFFREFFSFFFIYDPYILYLQKFLLKFPQGFFKKLFQWFLQKYLWASSRNSLFYSSNRCYRSSSVVISLLELFLFCLRTEVVLQEDATVQRVDFRSDGRQFGPWWVIGQQQRRR